MLKQTEPPDFLTRGLGPDNGTSVICLSDQVFLQFMFGALGYLFFAIINVKNKDEMQPACFFAVIIQRYICTFNSRSSMCFKLKLQLRYLKIVMLNQCCSSLNTQI